jgi:SAM-dependent methyltransferase
LELGAESLVVELASNDGCLLEQFAHRGVPVLGVEPAANVAAAAIDKGIATRVDFFGAELARELVTDRPADLIVANNVLAHVPDLHDFVEGIATLLAPEGMVSVEFPHLLRLIEDCQFDTIYHEHFSYFSLHAVRPVLEAHGLAVVDVDGLPTHGGSLRLWLRHASEGVAPSGRVEAVVNAEREAALDVIATYDGFADQVATMKRDLVDAVVTLKEKGLRLAGYGAPAKGNTLLNYCGIGSDLLDFTVDANPWKQGLFLPGTHIPVLAVEEVRRRRPDILFVLPWNIEAEIVESMAFVREWGGRFLVRRPGPELVE